MYFLFLYIATTCSVQEEKVNYPLGGASLVSIVFTTKAKCGSEIICL